jgi:hypothetical protein
MLQSGTFLQYGTYKDISKKYHPQSFIIHHWSLINIWNEDKDE